MDDGEGGNSGMREDLITSPGSCGSGSQAEGAYEFGHDMDDESGVDSPYHESQQHLPPLRGGMMMAGYSEDPMTMTDMAKYNLDRKFQL